MAKIIRMPEVAANATSAVLIAWLKKEGDLISVGDCLAEIETDKAIIEFEADEPGVMGEILVNAGAEVEVGAPIAVLLEDSKEVVNIQEILSIKKDRVDVTTPSNDLPKEMTNKVDVSVDIHEGKRIHASPLAKKLASQEGLNLAELSGSGPNGRIVKRDIYEALNNKQKPVPESKQAQKLDTELAYSEIPHSAMRRTIARRMLESKTSIPHFYLRAECNMSNLLALRQQINSNICKRISVNDFVVKAVGTALAELPQMNVSWTDEALLQYENIDISVAVSTERGLITPVIRDVQKKSISQISSSITDLAQRAKEGKLVPNEYQGGSFTVSNLGMFGVSEFMAIINPPQAAILAVGAIEERAVVLDGVIAVAPMMTITLSVDHRAIDGSLAAEWLVVLKKIIENPLSALI